jgi:hypothetical protein
MFDIYVICLLFLAPILFGMTGDPRMILWSLCAIHFLVVFFSKFGYGVIKILPMQVHGVLELLVGLSMPFMPYVFGFADMPNARHFFDGFAFFLLIFWFLTDYAYPGNAWTKGAEIGGHSHDDGHDHHGHDHSHAHVNGHSHTH